MADRESKARARRTAEGRAGSSATRVLGLLDLFTPEAPLWTAEAFAARLGLARATAYRYIKALADAASSRRRPAAAGCWGRASSSSTGRSGSPTRCCRPVRR